ncbi:MAG: DNA methyltransferase, partial [Acidobacteriaceae bacterium]
MAKRPFNNHLNDLSAKDWLKFQKSWFIHNPPPRQKEVLRHPAKFPETLAMEFISFYTKSRQVVLDPMAGTGSTLLAALRTGRNSFGIELNPAYSQIASQILDDEKRSLGQAIEGLRCEMITGDANRLDEIIAQSQIPLIDYVLTSPPYWDMLHARGASTQRSRRSTGELDVFYSDHPKDLGNIHDYDEFLHNLVQIYVRMKPHLCQGAYLTIIV